jgi:hypothetical protein
VYETCPSATNPAACGGADANRRVPALKADDPNGKQAEFLAWASASGYGTVHLQDGGEVWWSHVARGSYDIRNVNLDSGVSDGCGSPASPTASTDYGERLYFDFDCDGFLSDDERDEDADGLTNYDEAHGRLTPEFWAGCYDKEVAYPVAYAGTSMTDADSDGDGVRDGADDQDHDDLPNLMELSRFRASVGQAPVDPVTNPLGYYNDTEGRLCKPIQGLDPTAPNHPNAYGKVQPFDPCDPMPSSRTCQRHPVLGTDPDPNWWSLQ